MVYKHVYNHLVKNNLIYKYQSGFLPKHSTVHQLLELYNSILNSLEKKEFSCFVFCDFAKAFDKVWHNGLIHKMNSYGIQGKLIQWFENYLFKRRQKVINKNSWSSFEPVSAGVPQGSVLGPLMFLIYINDIGEKLISLSRLFADDTSLGYSSQSVDQIKTVLNHDLLELNAWFSKWVMSFNPEKTEILFFSNTGNIDNIEFSFNGKSIPLSTSHKHLGVILSQNAKWNEHLENMITNITKHLGILRKLKFSLNRSNLEKMYLVYIRPLFEYACEVWDNCGIGYLDKLEKLQLDAARIVTGLPILTKSEYLYAETGLETLSERRYRRKLQLFFNIKCGMAPEYLRHLVPPTIQSTTIYPLRNGDNLIVPFCRLSITNSSFIPSTVKEWNTLDIAIRKLDSLSKFKNAIRLNSQSNKISVPKLYYYGPRKLNVILTQIRCTSSFLNHDLHKVHILSSPACSCGAPQEDANHFFFVCTKYSEIRNELFLSISDLSQSINTSLITSGSETLSYADNCFIFYSVFRFIKRSKRFLIV